MKFKFAVLVAAMLVLFLCAASPVATSKISIEIGNGDTMNDIMQRNVGKFVEIKLNSGETLSGRLVRTNPNLLHISKITGRNYFDAVVRIDDVSALIVQVNQ